MRDGMGMVFVGLGVDDIIVVVSFVLWVGVI